MPVVRVEIKPEIIKWAISQADETKLNEKLNDNIKKWINGSKTPTFKQIEELSKKTNIPIGYFFLDEPPEEDIGLLEYRTIDNVSMTNPSRDLIDVIYEMESIQSWMKEYRLENGYDELYFVGSLKYKKSVQSMARQIRDDLLLDEEWYKKCKNSYDAFKYIRELLDEMGIIVMLNGIVGNNTHRALNIEEFRAFAIVDEIAPLLFINNSDSDGAKLFSLFHEMVHVWIGENDLYNDRRDNNRVKNTEVLCNGVASELLVPNEKFLIKWDDNKDYRRVIKELSQYFRCSESVIARKALNNNKIDVSLYRTVIDDGIEAYNKMKNRKSEGGDYYSSKKTRLNNSLIKALCESISSGRTTYTEAYRLTNTTRKTFDEVISRFGGVV